MPSGRKMLGVDVDLHMAFLVRLGNSPACHCNTLLNFSCFVTVYSPPRQIELRSYYITCKLIGIFLYGDDYILLVMSAFKMEMIINFASLFSTLAE